MKLRGTRVQYVFLLHRNCFLLINMLENFIKFQNYKILRKTFLKFNIFQKIQNDKIKLNLKNLKNSPNFHKISKLSKIS
jgi:hypothetical protein